MSANFALLFNGKSLAQEQEAQGRMWTFENPPLTYLENQYGFKPNQEWLDALRLGSLLIDGKELPSGVGSAAFVSAKGLIMTSGRCVRDAVQRTRELGDDAITTGFAAKSTEQEIRLRSRYDKWLSIQQLIKMSDVTDQVNNGVTPSGGPIQAKRIRDANKTAILAAARKTDPDLEPEIVNLHHGGVFQLYQYKVYTDVRLVFVPHLQVARFGGNADRFIYPSFCLDFAFLRAYEDDKPVDTSKHYFRWKPGGPEKGELVFVSGNPGMTKRQFTKSQLELERDISIPIEIERLSNALKILKENLNPSWHAWPQFRNNIIRLEDDLKAARIQLRSLNNENLMQQKAAAEADVRARLMTEDRLAEKYDDLLDRIVRMTEERRAVEAQVRFYSTNKLGAFELAVDIVRSCDPTESESVRSQSIKNLDDWKDHVPSDNIFGRLFFVDHVTRARNWLPKDDPYISTVLSGEEGGEFIKAVYADGRFVAGHADSADSEKIEASVVMKPEQRRALISSGWEGIQQSQDPAIVAARNFVALMRKHKERISELEAKEEALEIELSKAMFDCYGKAMSPDATQTLRFTDGVIQGLPIGDTVAPHRTTFFGLYGHNTEFDNSYPFELPAIWTERMGQIDLATSVTFASTNDISSDSFGSVVVNKNLEVVGLVIDANVESLKNEYVFMDEGHRAISVHVDGMVETLSKIYDGQHIVDELMGK